MLPTGYRQLNYITGSANAYSIIPIHLTDEDVVKAKVEIKANCNIFGCYTGSDATDNFSLYAGSKYYVRIDGELNNSVTSTKNQVVEFEMSKTGLLEDGVQVASFSGVSTFTTSTYFYIGWLDNASSAKFTGDFYCIEVVGKFVGVPALRESDGVAGWYDTLNGVFYTSNGSAWTAGTEAQKIPNFWLLMRRRAIMPQTTITSFVPGYDGYNWLYYNIPQAGVSTRLFYFKNNIDGNILIDGVEYSPLENFSFAEAGVHLVKYKDTGAGHERRFSGCTTLTHAYMQGDVAFYQATFQGCTSLSVVQFLNPTTISADCFFGCTSLTSATLDNVTQIRNGTIRNWPVTSLILPDLVTAGKSGDGYGVFENTSALTYVEIGPNVTEAYSTPFYNSSVTTLVIRATTPPTGSWVYGWNNTHKIYVPYSADHSILTAYQTASGWSASASSIYELTESGEIPE